jgi:muconolactone delta-isomerase
VPNKPATSIMGFRIPDDLRAEIERVAADNAETYTDLAIRALWREVRRWPED